MKRADDMDTTKKYILVKDYITDKIAGKEFLPSEKIPSESELSSILGVSNITVRRALSDLVNEKVIYREKGKGSFVSGQINKRISNHLVSIILATQDFNDSSYLKIIRGSQNRLAESGYALIVEWARGDIQSQHEVIEKLLERKIDGLLLYPFHPEEELSIYLKIERNHLPYVLLDRYSNKHRSCYVGCNNYGGVYEATSFLLNKNHKKLKFISFDINLNSEQERYSGFSDALKGANLPVDQNSLIFEGELDYIKLAESIKKHEVTALCCCNDKIAVKVMKRLLSLGVEIPKEVSLFGFDDELAAQTAPVGLSTVRQSFETVGAYAADLLLRHISHEDDSYNTQIRVGTELVLRDSVAENIWA